MMFTQFSMKEAKADFNRGYLKSVRIELQPFDFGYRVILTSVGGWAGPLVDAREGYTREFKTLGSAFSAVESIGFKCLALDCVF